MECVFCEIVAGKMPAALVWEDEKYLAILDLFPARTGQTIVIPKTHKPGYAFDLDDADLAGLTLAAKKVAGMLDKGLGAMRTCMLYEGLGVDHVHAKLYPVMKGQDTEGLVPLGMKAEESELVKLAQSLREGGMNG